MQSRRMKNNASHHNENRQERVVIGVANRAICYHDLVQLIRLNFLVR
jgi:hypothetical protein